MAKITKTFPYGNHTVKIETGEIARQATGAVMASMGDTVVQVTVVGMRQSAPDRDFFPLTVDYQERSYAAGRIPGGFFKREGRPSEKEILTSRLIDRPIRPLFPKSFTNEVQIIATVMSLDPDIDPDIISLIGASAALSLSGMPFKGPLGAARVGYRDGRYLLNPGMSDLATSALDLVVAGTRNAVLMVESEAKVLPEDVMLGAVLFGHEQMRAVIQAIDELVAEAKVQPWDWTPPAKDTELTTAIATAIGAELTAAYQIREKLPRQDRVAELRDKAVAELAGEAPKPNADQVLAAFGALEKRIVRGRILSGEPRID